MLVQERGHLLNKDELMEKVWPNDKFVEEGNLTRNVSTLRMILGETPGKHEYIETVPKRGYRFVATVRDVSDNGSEVIVDEPSKLQVVTEKREDMSGQDHTERASEHDAELTTSEFRALEAETIPRLGDSALLQQATPVPTDTGPLLGRIRTSGNSLALVGIITAATAVLVYVLFFRGAPVARPPEIKSLAVLPLKSLSKDSNDDYLGLGIADAIIIKVSQNGELTVRPYNAVRKYANLETDPLTAAQQLKVDSVLDGTVQRAGDHLRVNLNLLRVSDGASLWSGSFNPSSTDIFKMQDEVSQQVVTRLRLKLKPQEQARLSSTRPVSPEAYDFYLRAKYHSGLENKADIEASIELLEQAVAIDPSFALAYAELSHAYRNKAANLKPEEKEWEEKAFAAVEKALVQDPDLADAHLSRGILLWTHPYHFPHERTVEEYRRALDLNPNLAEAHHQLANVYNHIGLLDKAQDELQRALAINPSDTGTRFRVGVNLLYQGRDEQALEAFRDSERFHPQLWPYQTACALFHLGRREEAATRVGEALKNNPQDEGGALTSIQALLAASAGDAAAAAAKIKRAAELGKDFGHFHHTAYTIACAYALLNKAEPAMDWLQRAADDGFPCYPLFERDPNLDHLRKDPRFIAFMAKLKEQWEHYKASL